MRTLWMLCAMYDGRPVVTADEVSRDFFAHLSTEKFIRKIDGGEIDLPLMRIEKSSKAARLVHLMDLAEYLDARALEARNIVDKINGRGRNK